MSVCAGNDRRVFDKRGIPCIQFTPMGSNGALLVLFCFFFSLSLPREKTRAPRSQWVDLLAGRAWNERLSSLSLGRGSRTLAVANANASAMLVILSSPPAAAAAAAAAAGVRCQHRHRQQVWCSALARFFFSSPPSLSSSYSFLKVASRERSASGESRE